LLYIAYIISQLSKHMKISWIESDLLAASGIPLDAKDLRSLQQQGIRAILSLTEQPLLAQREITSDILEALDIRLFHVPVRDQYPPDAAQVKQILTVIHTMQSDHRPLLIHCHAGIGRTGTILHLYYLAQGHTFAQAREHIRQKRVQCILLSDEQMQFLAAYSASSKQ
jgi:atypical dual specificity phosphatase